MLPFGEADRALVQGTTHDRWASLWVVFSIAQLDPNANDKLEAYFQNLS